ncbi:MAG: segregation/condensation protein A [Lachnospiraceae bacterium]|nr:segregation/condensation protein A [Lachnospiraceae bacterium]
MGIPVKLQAFEGPLDLLLHLIEKNKVNIYDIPIVEITEQYMAYIRQMEKEDLNIMSEFLVMAAQLLDIKAKMLLPKEINEEGEEEDPRQELVQQLLEYKMYKYMAYELKERQIDAVKSLYKRPTLPKEISEYEPPVDLKQILQGTDLVRLYGVFKEIMRRQEDKLDPIRSRFGTIEKEEVSLSEKLETIENYARLHKTFFFSELFKASKNKMEMIVTFLAVLELIKVGKVNTKQEHTFSDIVIIFTEKEENLEKSESTMINESSSQKKAYGSGGGQNGKN